LVNSKNKILSENKDYAVHQEKMKKEADLLFAEKKLNLS